MTGTERKSGGCLPCTGFVCVKYIWPVKKMETTQIKPLGTGMPSRTSNRTHALGRRCPIHHISGGTAVAKDYGLPYNVPAGANQGN